MNQKGFVNIALIILVVIIAEMAGYFALHKTPSTPASQGVDQIQNPTQTKVTKSEIKNWKTYRNEELNFEVRYPDEYKISVQNGKDLGINYSSKNAKDYRVKIEKGSYRIVFNDSPELPAFLGRDEWRGSGRGGGERGVSPGGGGGSGGRSCFPRVEESSERVCERALRTEGS